MPLYEYEADGDSCPFCEGRFEVLQQLGDEPLGACPQCGKSCHRVFSSFAPIKSTKDMLSPKNLAAKGLTQYKKAGGGHYEKTCGDGPNVIKGD